MQGVPSHPTIMSAASSDSLVKQAHEHPLSGTPGSSLAELHIPTDKPIIAVDLDDVLSQTNKVVMEWHNDTYGTNLTLDECYYYYYWKNPHWGTPDETFRKVEEFYQTGRLDSAPRIEGAVEGVLTLRDMGFRLVVVTARQRRELERSMAWLHSNFGDAFETMICTGQSQETLADEHDALTKLSKAEVCRKIGARLMIDDSVENALKCATADPPMPVLLFGDNQWNQRVATYGDIKDELSFAQKLEKEGGREFWKEETVTIPEGAPMTRVKDWHGVVRWVKQNIEV
ncbi:hypothetical protein B0H21DRAFT_429036 [Amylocystis lapponica]|nr:hypothetical protein B0H21DRAFT_429036 [Amylocystis lapponica]